jgi:hypothetical protein
MTRSDGTDFSGWGFSANIRDRTWGFSSGIQGAYFWEDDDAEEGAVTQPVEEAEATDPATEAEVTEPGAEADAETAETESGELTTEE